MSSSNIGSYYAVPTAAEITSNRTGFLFNTSNASQANFIRATNQLPVKSVILAAAMSGYTASIPTKYSNNQLVALSDITISKNQVTPPSPPTPTGTGKVSIILLNSSGTPMNVSQLNSSYGMLHCTAGAYSGGNTASEYRTWLDNSYNSTQQFGISDFSITTITGGIVVLNIKPVNVSWQTGVYHFACVNSSYSKMLLWAITLNASDISSLQNGNNKSGSANILKELSLS